MLPIINLYMLMPKCNENKPKLSYMEDRPQEDITGFPITLFPSSYNFLPMMFGSMCNFADTEYTIFESSMNLCLFKFFYMYN